MDAYSKITSRLPLSEVSKAPKERFVCYGCGRNFRSKRGLWIHLGHCRDVSEYVFAEPDGTFTAQCPDCGKDITVSDISDKGVGYSTCSCGVTVGFSKAQLDAARGSLGTVPENYKASEKVLSDIRKAVEEVMPEESVEETVVEPQICKPVEKPSLPVAMKKWKPQLKPSVDGVELASSLLMKFMPRNAFPLRGYQVPVPTRKGTRYLEPHFAVYSDEQMEKADGKDVQKMFRAPIVVHLLSEGDELYQSKDWSPEVYAQRVLRTYQKLGLIAYVIWEHEVRLDLQSSSEEVLDFVTDALEGDF